MCVSAYALMLVYVNVYSSYIYIRVRRHRYWRFVHFQKESGSLGRKRECENWRSVACREAHWHGAVSGYYTHSDEAALFGDAAIT